jgi:hypothetical protein
MLGYVHSGNMYTHTQHFFFTENMFVVTLMLSFGLNVETHNAPTDVWFLTSLLACVNYFQCTYYNNHMCLYKETCSKTWIYWQDKLVSLGLIGLTVNNQTVVLWRKWRILDYLTALLSSAVSKDHQGFSVQCFTALHFYWRGPILKHLNTFTETWLQYRENIQKQNACRKSECLLLRTAKSLKVSDLRHERMGMPHTRTCTHTQSSTSQMIWQK